MPCRKPTARQPFSASVIGQNKATVLINRINLFWGTNWQAVPNQFHARSFDGNFDRCPDLVTECVDTRAARRAVEESVTRALKNTCYWLKASALSYRLRMGSRRLLE
jgi:hypothetical protein